MFIQHLPNELTEEQHEAIESIKNPEKSHWLVRKVYFISGFLVILSFISVLNMDWGAVISFGILAFMLYHIGHKIQIVIAGDKFFKYKERK